MRHLIGAHHDANQFVYDLELLGHYGLLHDLTAKVRALLASDDAHTHWLRDLTVFEGYHEALLAAAEHAAAGGPAMSAAEAGDPDLSFGAYVRWCAAQPATPRDTLHAWRAGTFRLDSPGIDASTRRATAEAA